MTDDAINKEIRRTKIRIAAFDAARKLPVDAPLSHYIEAALNAATPLIRAELIEEMREPSAQMLTASRRKAELGTMGSTEVWQAMLDAFTAEQEGKGDE